MSKKLGDILKSSPHFHVDNDVWGTDEHDATILKAVGTVIVAIGTAIATIIGAKKK